MGLEVRIVYEKHGYSIYFLGKLVGGCSRFGPDKAHETARAIKKAFQAFGRKDIEIKMDPDWDKRRTYRRKK